MAPFFFFLTGGESNRRASDKGWESERPNAETRGGGRSKGGRERGRRGERGMKSSEGGKKQHSEAQVAERAEHSRGPEPSGCCAREPGPAPPSWGPRGPRPPGGGGEDQLGSRRSPVRPRAEPGSATAAGRRRERSAASGGCRQGPALQPRPRREREYFSNDSNFPPFPAFWGLSWLELLF